MKTPISMVALSAALFAAAAAAQRPLDPPPPMPAQTPPSERAPAPAAQGSRKPLARISESERTSQDKAGKADEPLTEPPDDQLLPPARKGAPETRIEQIRQGNRIVEIVVTPQGSTSSYVIVNREGRPPLTTQELSSGLSTPRFWRFDF